jgi:hypothetical protein
MAQQQLDRTQISSATADQRYASGEGHGG